MPEIIYPHAKEALCENIPCKDGLCNKYPTQRGALRQKKEEFFMKRSTKGVALLVSMLLIAAMFAGCGQNEVIDDPQEEVALVDHVELHDPADASSENGDVLIDISNEMVPLTAFPAMFATMPVASGTLVSANEKASVDYSNTTDGYVMVKYQENTDKALKVLVVGPSTTTYTYSLKSNGEYEVYPLSDGNGSYTVTVYENVDGSKYATANAVSFSVSLTDEFAPFVRPNQYVNYNANSATVAKANEIAGGQGDTLGKIGAIFDYVTSHLSYDEALAQNVKSGYLPDVDAVLASGKGICFDYAAVMTAMLRSQGIPTKLVVGYTGDIYHAWINVYSEDGGWMGSVVYFDGNDWKLTDPTFYSTGGGSDSVKQYIGDGSNYTAKYLY